MQAQRGIALKREIRNLLTSDDLPGTLEQLGSLPPQRIISPLISCLSDMNQNVKWHAVTIIGAVVSQRARGEAEWGRVIMRRLIWSLNDESGGIGWGAPEAMAEIMSRDSGLAAEYAHMLLSYLREDGNFLENEELRRGVLWGIGRLAQINPDLMKDAACLILPYLESKNPALRGMASWAVTLLRHPAAKYFLENLLTDDSPVAIYCNDILSSYRVRDLALQALHSLSPTGSRVCSD